MAHYNSIQSIQRLEIDTNIGASDFKGENQQIGDSIQESYLTKAESMVRTSKKSANRYFNVEKQAGPTFVKASNVLLEPFSLTQRNQDNKAHKQIRMPPNPIGV